MNAKILLDFFGSISYFWLLQVKTYWWSFFNILEFYLAKLLLYHGKWPIIIRALLIWFQQIY